MNQPNILFIVADALRARNLGCYGYCKNTSPNIDKLADEGVVFENAFSCSTYTYPSLTSIFTGKYPRSHGVMTQIATPRQAPRSQLLGQTLQRLNESQSIFLAEVLKSKGYATAAVDWVGRWTKRGFDYYSGDVTSASQKLSPYLLAFYRIVDKHLHLPNKIVQSLIGFRRQSRKLKVHGSAVTREAIKLIRELHKKSFFLFLHYWDTHTIYDPPRYSTDKFQDYGQYDNLGLGEISSPSTMERLRKRVLPELKTVGEVLARYDGAISFVDEEFGRLIKVLESWGISDNTLIILTSDHGESLTEHGIYFSHHGLYDVTIQVPLIVRYQGLPKGKRIRSLVQHIDILPTMLNILNISGRSLSLDGSSLIPLMYDKAGRWRKAVYIEESEVEQKAAIRTESYKYIRSPSAKQALCKECGLIHGGVEELYDLTQDPEETVNVAEDKPRQVQKLKSRLLRFLSQYGVKKSLEPSDERKRSEDSSPEEERMILKRLRALGYMD
ncbi:MAG: sulfatase [Candidatus Bathyarchaeota archaeon]|nr:MAG: sulfatase [Candidatus Bathyarchaeota archaeon]